jgi:hypothetical protein
MSGSTGAEETPDAAWGRFEAQHGAQLAAWLEAERLVAEAHLRGGPDFDAGDRLLAAEAALQTAIIDFAAASPGYDNPGPLAVEVLRRADEMLAAARAGRARGVRAPGSPGEQDPADPAR